MAPASAAASVLVGASVVAGASRPSGPFADGPVRTISASRDGSCHSGTPSALQSTAICHRGRGSPGYHLPWP